MAEMWAKARKLFEKLMESINLDKIREIISNEGVGGLISRLKDSAIGDVQTLYQLLKDYCSGEYKEVPWKFIVSIGAAFAYLLLPIDAIPDFIPGVGLIDDAAVFGMVISSFKDELDKYRLWKGTSVKALENNDNE